MCAILCPYDRSETGEVLLLHLQMGILQERQSSCY